MNKKLKIVGIVVNIIAIIFLLIYCLMLTLTINKQSTTLEEQNERIIMLQMDNMVNLKPNFYIQISASNQVTFPAEFENKNINFYIAEYQKGTKINEKWITLIDLSDEALLDNNYFANLKLFTNEESNEMEYSIAFGSENTGYMQGFTSATIPADEYLSQINRVSSNGYGILVLDSENKYPISSIMFGGNKIEFYALPE